MADLKRFFKKTVSEDRHKQAASVSVPEGLWIKCPKCGEMVYREDVYPTPMCARNAEDISESVRNAGSK